MRTIWLSLLGMGLVVFLASPTLAQGPGVETAPASPARHYVFAHYMVCYATYGESREGYKREIREAQAAGIDGFALNVGASRREPHYLRRTRLLYQAARELNTGFKLFFSVDLSEVPDILDMIRTYARHPQQFVYQGRVVVSTFSQERLAWYDKVLQPLQKSGCDVFFVPYFYPRPQATELPSFATVVQLLKTHSQTVDGLFYFGGAGTSRQLAEANTAYARALREASKLFMASYTPTYWGQRQPDRRYFETEGGKGTAQQWQAILKAQPQWVEIVTWNDFNESTYVCPVENPERYFAELKEPHRHSHAGYLELSKHFIAWYKEGKQPAMSRDGLFFFYRTHPAEAIASGTDQPVTLRHGRVEDVIHLTTLLTAPAEVRVASGRSQARHQVKAGMQDLRVPFVAGPQRFELWRDGRCVLNLEGPAISEQPVRYNFFTASGFTYGSPGQ